MARNFFFYNFALIIHENNRSFTQKAAPAENFLKIALKKTLKYVPFFERKFWWGRMHPPHPPPPVSAPGYRLLIVLLLDLTCYINIGEMFVLDGDVIGLI